MKPVLKNICCVFFLLFISASTASAQLVVSQVSTWKKDVDAADLSIPNEAGADLNSTVETSPNFNQLDIRNLADAKGWKISVSRQDINWPAAFTLSVKRTSNGIPCVTCAGVNTGSSVSGYIPLGTLEQDFIFGNGEVSNIGLQFKIDGISLVVDAQSYSTEIMYTLYGD